MAEIGALNMIQSIKYTEDIRLAPDTELVCYCSREISILLGQEEKTLVDPIQ